MPLTMKDAGGLALAACTVVFLVVHGGSPHDEAAPRTVDEPGLAPAGVAASASLTGIDSVGLSSEGRVVDGRRTDYLTSVRETVTPDAIHRAGPTPGSGAEARPFAGDPPHGGSH